jgi:hypothetical protein
VSALEKLTFERAHDAAIAGTTFARRRREPRRELLPVCACGRSATRRNTSGTELCEECSKLIGRDGRG